MMLATVDHGGMGAWRPPAPDYGAHRRAPVKEGRGTHFRKHFG